MEQRRPIHVPWTASVACQMIESIVRLVRVKLLSEPKIKDFDVASNIKADAEQKQAKAGEIDSTDRRSHHDHVSALLVWFQVAIHNVQVVQMLERNRQIVRDRHSLYPKGQLLLAFSIHQFLHTSKFLFLPLR